MNIHHIGVATCDMAQSLREYEALGFEKASSPVYDRDRNLLIQFISDSVVRIELLAVLDTEKPSPIDAILKSSREPHNAMYHFCYEVADILKAIGDLRSLQYILIAPPAPAAAFGGRQVAFLYRKNFGIVELFESGGDPVHE